MVIWNYLAAVYRTSWHAARSVAENYRAFAQDALGRSPIYESLAGPVAEDTAILRFLGSLPPEKRQPNLLFAVAPLPAGRASRPGPAARR